MKKKQPQSPSHQAQSQPKSKLFKVRVTGEVLDTAHGTRKHQVNGHVLTAPAGDAINRGDGSGSPAGP